MMHSPMLARAARHIHARLEAIGSGPPSVALPEETWYECQRLIQLTRITERRGWPAAAGRLQERLASALASFRGRVDDAIVALEPKPPQRVPSLREVYEELRSLWAEFDEVALDLKEHRLSVTTAPIVLEDVELGRFEIRLDWRRLDCHLPYDVVALDPNPASGDSGTTHPHVQNEHLCEGEGRRPIRQALREGRLGDFFTIVQQVLCTYNAGSAYVSLSNWTGRPCSDCGDSVAEDEDYGCSRCSCSLCSDCSVRCSMCEECYCTECLDTCEACHVSISRHCRTACARCQGEFCHECLGDGCCEECRQDRNEGEEPHGAKADAAEAPADAPASP